MVKDETVWVVKKSPTVYKSQNGGRVFSWQPGTVLMTVGMPLLQKKWNFFSEQRKRIIPNFYFYFLCCMAAAVFSSLMLGALYQSFSLSSFVDFHYFWVSFLGLPPSSCDSSGKSGRPWWRISCGQRLDDFAYMQSARRTLATSVSHLLFVM